MPVLADDVQLPLKLDPIDLKRLHIRSDDVFAQLRSILMTIGLASPGRVMIR